MSSDPVGISASMGGGKLMEPRHANGLDGRCRKSRAIWGRWPWCSLCGASNFGSRRNVGSWPGPTV